MSPTFPGWYELRPATWDRPGQWELRRASIGPSGEKLEEPRGEEACSLSYQVLCSRAEASSTVKLALCKAEGRLWVQWPCGNLSLSRLTCVERLGLCCSCCLSDTLNWRLLFLFKRLSVCLSRGMCLSIYPSSDSRKGHLAPGNHSHLWATWCGCWDQTLSLW